MENSSEVKAGNAIVKVQSLCHDSSEPNQYVGAYHLKRFDNIFSASGIYFSRTRYARRGLLLAQYGQLLRIAQAGIERLQLRELALLRRAREHVIANDLQLVAQIRQQ